MEQALLASSAIPVGAILSFAGESNRVPNGWLICNGQVLSKDDYPILFNAIGTVWGGSGTPQFYLPDMRGLFLRGVSGESNADPDKNDRYSPQLQHSPTNPGSKGNQVGSLQGDSFKLHDHGFEDKGHRHFFNKGTTIDSWGGHVVASGQIAGQSGVTVEKSNISFSKEGGSETRPINAYVHFIIKVDDRIEG